MKAAGGSVIPLIIFPDSDPLVDAGLDFFAILSMEGGSKGCKRI